MAAFSAAEEGSRVTLLEKNEKPGKKIYITGKGRCNLTNDRPVREFLPNIVTNPRFLYPALYGFSPEDTIRFFEESGCPVKVERGQRAFPVSDHSSDVIRALVKRCEQAGVASRFHTAVRRVIVRDGRAAGVILKSGEELSADAVILCTGGLAYPQTGSTGDGYRMAEELGHRIEPQEPSLVPFEIREDWCPSLQGLTLKNVSLTMTAEGMKKPLFADQGEMLFTHFGVSGPLVLSASARYHKGLKGVRLSVDLKPALTPEQLDQRLVRTFDEEHGKAFKNALGSLFPQKLIPVMTSLSGIDPMKRAGEITKKERLAFGGLIKSLTMTVAGTRGFAEAVVTRGGVSVREVDPHTMQSRIVPGLYFAGEILDTDALTGGYNLQTAWSTGRLAGIQAAQEQR